MDEDDELPDEVRFVAALNETAKPGVDNQLFWVLANHPQWWDLVLEAEVRAITDQWSYETHEIRVHGGRKIQFPYGSSGWLSRNDLRDLFGADHPSGKPRESSRTELLRLRVRGDIRVEKVNPHGWVCLPLGRKRKLQTELWALRDLWDFLQLSTAIGVLLGLGILAIVIAAGYFALQILFGLSLDLFGL